MLLKRATMEGIRAGTVTLAFRRWKRPTVKAGGRLRTAIGELETRRFKARVRRLKERGLAQSLEVGYRLSPRGAAYLKR